MQYGLWADVLCASRQLLCLTCEFANCRLKSKVQHAIRLVKHKKAHSIKPATIIRIDGKTCTV